MQSAFYGCEHLGISAIDTPDLSQVTDMSNMFHGASSFDSNLSEWDISSVMTMSNMLSNTALSTYHYNEILSHRSNQIVKS